jgi:hypothetical protein
VGWWGRFPPAHNAFEEFRKQDSTAGPRLEASGPPRPPMQGVYMADKSPRQSVPRPSTRRRVRMCFTAESIEATKAYINSSRWHVARDHLRSRRRSPAGTRDLSGHVDGAWWPRTGNLTAAAGSLGRAVSAARRCRSRASVTRRSSVTTARSTSSALAPSTHTATRPANGPTSKATRRGSRSVSGVDGPPLLARSHCR